MAKIFLLTVLAASMAGVTAVVRIRRTWNKDRYLLLKGRELEAAIKAQKERMSTNSILEDIEKGLLD